jgi:hypothetical protein
MSSGGAAGLGSTVVALRERTSKRAREQNRGCALLSLLDQSADIRDGVLTANAHCLGLVTLWRLRVVSRQWGPWVDVAMRSLPSLVIQGSSGTQAADHDSLSALSFSEMRWTALPRAGLRRHSHAACSTASGEVVIAGGSERVEIAVDHPLGGRINADSRSLEVLCGGEWRTHPHIALPVVLCRKGCIVCLQDGSLLALGGLAEDNRTSADVWILRYEANCSGASNSGGGGEPPAQGAWKKLAPMHRSRADFAAGVLHDGRVIVAGGLGSEACAPDNVPPSTVHIKMLKCAEVYDPSKNQWSRLPDMQYGRSACRGCVEKTGAFIVSGGRGLQSGPLSMPLDAVECFLPAGHPYEAEQQQRDQYQSGKLEGCWVDHSCGGATNAPIKHECRDSLPPPLRCRSVGHSMVCIAGDLIVIGPAFASGSGGGGSSARGGVGSGLGAGGGFGAMILLGTDHCPDKLPRWRRLRLPIPCTGRSCTALAVQAGCTTNFLGEKTAPSPPSLTATEVENAWAMLMKHRAVKLCVELLTQCPAAAEKVQHASATAEDRGGERCRDGRAGTSATPSRSASGPVVAFASMIADQNARTPPPQQLKPTQTVGTSSDADVLAAIFRPPLLTRAGLLEGLRVAGAAAALPLWSTPPSVRLLPCID